MSDLIVAPDALALVVGWLESQAEMNALVNGRIVAKLPATKTYPLIWVARIGGGEVDGVKHWLHDPLFQFSCLAAKGGETAAFNVARVATALLSQRFRGEVVGGSTEAVVSSVKLGGIHQGYDPIDTDIPTCRFDAQIHLHP